MGLTSEDYKVLEEILNKDTAYQLIEMTKLGCSLFIGVGFGVIVSNYF